MSLVGAAEHTVAGLHALTAHCAMYVLVLFTVREGGTKPVGPSNCVLKGRRTGSPEDGAGSVLRDGCSQTEENGKL